MTKLRWNLLAVVLICMAGCTASGGLTVQNEVGGDADSARQGPEIAVELTADEEGLHELPLQDEVWDFREEVEPQCEPGTGCFLDKCGQNSDCLSGFCVEHMGEGVCSTLCQEECAQGWTCRQVTGREPDVIYICVSDVANLCKPCSASVECASPGGAQDVCVDYGTQGSFCGGVCETAEDCPWGFSCGEAASVDGIESKQCVADAGICPCTERSVQLGLWTGCLSENEFGQCSGKRVCTAGGLSDCDAAVPALDVCNGLDDDCDGDTDEPAQVGGNYLNLCDDGNDCTEDQCLGETGCDHKALAQGECKDGDPCTVADHCVAGVCTGDPVQCDDENPCTDNLCMPDGGCAYEPNSAPCDDGDSCTVGDSCSEGKCTGVVFPCDCHEDADCLPLEDGNFCNGKLVCDKTVLPHLCKVDPTTVISCPDPVGPEAVCKKTSCDPGTGACGFASDHEGYACNDSDACTIGDTCAAGVCAPGPQAMCGDGNPCTDDSCDPVAGCKYVPNVLPCDDGNECTTGDGCQAGKCQPGAPLGCDDGNPCTADSCEAKSGCLHLATAGPCDDGNPCTLNDSCLAGQCKPGPFLVCNDGNTCTKDSCGADGSCKFEPTSGACDDGNACTKGDACQAGKCVSSLLLDCEDGDVCTTDSCDPAVGCVHKVNQAPCDDSDPCTLNDKCSAGQCKAGPTLVCNDGNTCTKDSCGADGACMFEPMAGACEDGNACTTGESCQAGKCVGAALLDCDDGDVCTTDSCDPATGCVHKLNEAPCDDGSVCTTGDHCHLGACISAGSIACDDGNPCTDDSCSPKTGCAFVANNSPCEDGEVCTVADICSAGICQPGGPKACDDGNPCTTDSCKLKVGCGAVPNSLPCDDQDQCTKDEFCAGGICGGGVAVTCDDSNICTDDSCHVALGCVFKANAAACNDADACTPVDICVDKACKGSGLLICDDSNVCTTDSCVSPSGCQYVPVQDGIACGNELSCQAGQCKPTCVPGSQTFSYTGQATTFTVPACAETLSIDAYGAQGGDSFTHNLSKGGNGGRVQATLTVDPGSVLTIRVGEKPTQQTGGFNGGGNGVKDPGQPTWIGAGGGGATDIRLGGDALSNRLLVAAGGGGACPNTPTDNGGIGGGLTGGNGNSNSAGSEGKGATQSAGGAGGTRSGYLPGSAGTLGTGGMAGSNTAGGGGGAGHYGGGGGSWGSGGGGSSWVSPVVGSGVTHTSGARVGHGQVTITW